MATLHCCLVGFDEGGISTVRGLASLFSEQLSAEWEFGDGLASPCHLLVCDMDTLVGAQAWRAHGFGQVRAMATAGEGAGHALMLRKPFRGYGLDGLIHVLNEGARMQAERTAPAAAPPAAPARAREGRWSLRSALRALPRFFTGFSSMPDFEPPKAAPPPKPAPAAPHPAQWTPPAPPAPEVAPRPAYSEPAYAEAPAGRASATALAVRTPERVLAGEIVPAPAHAHTHTHTETGVAIAPEVVEVNLLTALRRFRSLSQVAVIRFNDVPTICVVSETEMFYSLASLQKMYELPVASLTPARVTIARNSHQGRTEAQSYYQSGSSSYFVTMQATPLKHLFWVATLRCAGQDELYRYEEGTYRFKNRPDLALLPHEPYHVTWCGLMAKHSVTVASLARFTGNTPLQAAVFLSACDELGILERSDKAASQLLLGSDHPSDRNRGFRSFLNRLGFSR